MRELYLECAAGISGDMFVAAMLDLGADEDKLRKALDSLQLPGYEIKISHVKKGGIAARDFDVILEGEDAGKDHDMEYLHGPGGDHGHGHDHHHDHHHGHHDHTPDHDHHHDHHHGHHDHAPDHDHHHDHGHDHHHEHRHLSDILGIINRADLTDGARDLAKRIFGILGDAESKAHGVMADEVHFHEVGAVDSIVDIVSAAVCFDDLGFERVYIPRLAEGSGMVRCAHGVLPVPVPAVMNIVSDAGLTLSVMDVQGEFVTPTGAAIAAAIATDFALPDAFSIKQTGIGAGKRTYEVASMLRAMVIESKGRAASMEKILRLETDIDDVTGESLGFVMSRLYDAGAREVHFSPIYMKKNRPGTELVVICDEKDAQRMEDIIFEDTTTLGIRRILMDRRILPREKRLVETPYGTVKYQSVSLPDGTERMYPEYETIRAMAEKNGISYGRASLIAEKFRIINESMKDVML